MVDLTFKNAWFLNKQRLIEFCHYFFFNWPTCSLVSSKKKKLLFSLPSTEKNLFFFAILWVEFKFSGFDATIFHIFFITLRRWPIFQFFFSFYLKILLMTVQIVQFGVDQNNEK